MTLELSGLRKAFGGHEVLCGVDLSVPPGTLTALLGRSGSGKTTILRLVAGFDTPDAGTVTVGGRDVGGLAVQRRRIGYVTQEGNLFPHLSVAANVAFGLSYRERRTRRRVPELLELVGLDASYAPRPPHELSGGEQQRVALARALAPGPDLVLLDEPFSALDAELRATTRRAVAAALAATGTTTVLVTHDQAEALSLAGRVAVLRAGRIVQESSPAGLYLRPADPELAAFVGEVAEIPAMLDGDKASTPLGPVPLPSRVHGAGRVLVRPEQIELTDLAETSATVLAVDFRGHDAVVTLELSPAATITARCPAHLLPEPGRPVGVRVRGPALHALPD